VGYLTRKSHLDDGRARVVRLTGRGRRLEAAISEVGREVERTWRERIGEPASGVFREVLDQLAQADSVAARLAALIVTDRASCGLGERHGDRTRRRAAAAGHRPTQQHVRAGLEPATSCV
jgi:hypothetical protein